MTRPWLLLVAAIPLAAVVTALVLLRGDSKDAGLAPADTNATASVDLSAPGISSRHTAPSAGVGTDEGSPTATPFLESYWGDRWPAVRAALEAKGMNPEGYPVPPVPWEVAAEVLEQRLAQSPNVREGHKLNLLRWTGQVDDDWFQGEFNRSFRLDDAQRDHVRDLVHEWNARAEPLVEEFLDTLDFEVRNRWRAGRFVKAPWTTAGAPGGDQRGFFTKADAHEGWAMGMALTWEECPDLKELHGRINAILHDRNRAIYAYLTQRR